MANATETFKLPTGMGRLIRYSSNAAWTWQRWNRSRNKWVCRPTNETNRGKAEQIVYQLAATQHKRAARRHTISILFSTVAEQYIEARRTGHKCKKLAQGSLVLVRTALNCFRTSIGAEKYDTLQIGQVTESLLTRYVRDAAETVSVAAANRRLRVLFAILAFAVKRNHLADNPAKQVEAAYPKIMLGQEPEDQPITGWPCPTTQEVNLILAHAAPQLKPTGRTAYNGNGTPRKVYRGINANDYTSLYKTLCLTGMRIGEARHLTWDDVDFERHVLLIRPGLKNGTYWKPKTKSSIRRIAMIPELEAIIQHLRATNRRNIWVFESRRGTQVGEDNPTMVFRKICDQLGFEQHYVIHSLRKYWASTVAAQGMDAMMMIKMFGHTDFELIMKTYYAQNDDARMVAAAQKISFGLSDGTSNVVELPDVPHRHYP